MRILALLFSILVINNTSSNEDFILVNGKHFTVQGQTSIGKFNCNYDLKVKDTIYLNTNSDKSRLDYNVPVKNFGCGNFLLNKDFRQTLKAEQYPNARISLYNFKGQNGNYRCDLSLNLAGKQKIYKNLSLKKENKKLNGSITLNFSDFDLTPPNKLGGAIKIKDEITLSVVFMTD